MKIHIESQEGSYLILDWKNKKWAEINLVREALRVAIREMFAEFLDEEEIQVTFEDELEKEF